jgi:hypothetical protein
MLVITPNGPWQFPDLYDMMCDSALLADQTTAKTCSSISADWQGFKTNAATIGDITTANNNVVNLGGRNNH